MGQPVIVAITPNASLAEQLQALVRAMDGFTWGPTVTGYKATIPTATVVLVDMAADPTAAQAMVVTLAGQSSRPAIVALHSDMDADIILAALRSGADEFLQFPKDAASLEAVLRQVAARRQNNAPTAVPTAALTSCKVFGVFSAKGGGGATLVGVNLAQQLLRLTGKSVVLVDMHPQYNTLGHQLNLTFKHALGDVAATHPTALEEGLLEKMLTPFLPGLDVLVCCKNATDDGTQPSDALWTSVIKALHRQYDYVVLDLPSQVVDGTHQVVNTLADKVVLVSMMDLPSLSRTRQYLELVERYLDASKIALVLNRHTLEAATNIAHAKLEAAFHHDVFARLSNDWHLCIEAATLGKCLEDLKPNAALTKDIAQLASQLAETPLSKAGAEGGLLGKLKQWVPSKSAAKSGEA